MLVCVNKYCDLDINAIQTIYESDELHDLLSDIEISFKKHQGVLFFWEADGNYVSVLRAEPYQDGYLLFDLITKRGNRRRGYGTLLTKAVLTEIYSIEQKAVYVHIEKKNTASMKMHQNIGFQICADFGKLIDGTVSHRYFTLVYK